MDYLSAIHAFILTGFLGKQEKQIKRQGRKHKQFKKRKREKPTIIEIDKSIKLKYENPYKSKF